MCDTQDTFLVENSTVDPEMATHNEHVLLLGNSSLLAIYSVENSILVRGNEGYKFKHIYPPKGNKAFIYTSLPTYSILASKSNDAKFTHTPTCQNLSF
jgi:hypothetical protein